MLSVALLRVRDLVRVKLQNRVCYRLFARVFALLIPLRRIPGHINIFSCRKLFHPMCIPCSLHAIQLPHPQGIQLPNPASFHPQDQVHCHRSTQLLLHHKPCNRFLIDIFSCLKCCCPTSRIFLLNSRSVPRSPPQSLRPAQLLPPNLPLILPNFRRLLPRLVHQTNHPADLQGLQHLRQVSRAVDPVRGRAQSRSSVLRAKNLKLPLSTHYHLCQTLTLQKLSLLLGAFVNLRNAQRHGQ